MSIDMECSKSIGASEHRLDGRAVRWNWESQSGRGSCAAIRSAIAAQRLDGRIGTMLSLHHVNLGVPRGGRDGEGEFLVGFLGYRRLETPADAPTAQWFESEDGKQIHLSE